jgi:UTP--glucose-1-phosphate uridylyltransferase
LYRLLTGIIDIIISDNLKLKPLLADKLSNNSDVPKYLIIPAAGLGTRMKEVNPDLPKELLPVGNKPAIQYAVEEGTAAGINNIIVVINKEKEEIRKRIERLYRGSTSISFTFLYQKEPLGESDAIAYAQDIAGNNAVAVIYPDNVYLPAPGALKTLVPVYNKYKKDVVALSQVSPDIAHTISNAGRVDISPMNNGLFNIRRFIPKGDGHFIPRFKNELRACGMYISGAHVFDHIEMTRSTVSKGEFTDYPVRTSILRERGMIGCPLDGTVFDIGNPRGYDLCLKYIQAI